MNLNINKIKPNPINSTIYDDTDLTDLKNSIESNGQLEPIIINEQNEIISGHRRYFSMVQLEYTEVEVRKTDYENDIIALVEHNRHRQKTFSDILRESKILETELKSKLGGRGKRTDLNGGKKFVMADELAKKLGLGLSVLKQLRTIQNYEPQLLSQIDKGDLSVNKAYEIIRENHLGGKRKSSKDSFENGFKKLLKKYSPQSDEIGSILESTYPYNLNITKFKSTKSMIGLTTNGNIREENDFYPTPPYAVDEFLKYEKLEGSIWEVACGKGHMSKSIEKKYGSIESTDLIDRGYGTGGIDFLDDKNLHNVDTIITNPPFNLFTEFVSQSKKCATKKICMFGRTQYLEGSKRYKDIWVDEEFPLKKVYQYVDRISITKNDTNVEQRGMLSFCWYIFEKGYKGKPTIEWIKSKQKKTTLVVNQPTLDNLKKKRTELLDNLMMKQSLDARQLVMYNKINEFQRNGFEKDLMKDLKSQIWKPSNILDIEATVIEISNLKPKLELVKDEKSFSHLRRLIHSFEWVSTVGRLVKVLVKDESTDKILGILTYGSDLISVECRENYIGWSNHQKNTLRKINHTAVVSSIVPTQPFGFNFLGGKLIASLATTDLIRDIWKERYNDELIGLTTTSLFGSYSMYNGIPHWKKLGTSKGKVYLKPDNEIYLYWLKWVRENHREKYDEIMDGLKTSAKQKMLNFIFTQLGIKPSEFFVNQSRGVYFSPFYKNGNEFLRDEIESSDLIMKSQISGGMEYIDNYWKPKAINRYKKLMEENRTNDEILWYENVADKKSTFNQWISSRG